MALLSPNYFAQGMNAFDDQTKRLNQFAQTRASKEAGQAIASGDYQGGSNVLNSAGMLDQAHNVLADKQVLEDRQRLAQNDVADRAQKAKAIQIEGLSHLTQAIKQVQPGQREAWLKAQLPNIQQLGLPADQFATLDEAHLTDAALAPWEAMLGKAKEDYNIGGVRYSGGTNKPIAGFAEIDPHKTVYAAGEGPDAVSATPAAPMPAPAATAPASGSRGVRDNNPLNLTTLPSGQWAGQTGADGRFATFASPDAGFAAADQNLQTYATKHGINTLSGIINRWAPAGDGTNDPQAYAATVGKDIGVDPNQPLNLADPKVRAVVLHAMSKVELGGSGQQLAHAGGNPQGIASLAGGQGGDTVAPQPAHLPGFHLVGQAKPEWQDMADGRQRNVITGKVEGTPNSDDVPMSQEAVDMNATQVAMTGKLPAMGMGKAATANRTKIQNRAAELIKEWGVKPEDWVTGVAQFKVAQGSLQKISQTRNMVQASENAVTANMNTVVLPLMQKVQPGGVPFFNKYTMALRDRALGDPDVKAYDNALHTVADEYAKVMTTTSGAGGQTSSDSARQEAYRRLSTSQTGPQLVATFKALQAEMDNRRQALEQQEQALTGSLRNGLAPPGSTPAPQAQPVAPPGAKVRRYNPATGRLE